jgi:hypothetical protein
MQDSENSKGTTCRLVNDEIGENPIEKNVSIGQIGPAMAIAWRVGKFGKTFEEFGNKPVRRLHSFLL